MMPWLVEVKDCWALLMTSCVEVTSGDDTTACTAENDWKVDKQLRTAWDTWFAMIGTDRMNG